MDKAINKVQPLLSVCVPTYQHEQYIKKCLDGILTQKTHFSFEIIIGEDESTDGTREICIEYANKYPEKIRLFLRSRNDVIYINNKPSGRFNFMECLKAVRGKYVALCEGDDYWINENKLQKQVDFLESNPDFSICFHSANIIYNDNSTPNFLSNKDQKIISTIEDLAFGNFINTATGVFRNNLKNNLPSWYPSIAVGDWSLNLLNAQFGKIYFINEPMSVYRINPTSIWGNQSKLVMYERILSMLAVFEKELDPKYTIFFKRSRSSYYMNISDYYKEKKNKIKEFFYFYKACKTSDHYKMGNRDILHKFNEIFFSKNIDRNT